MQCEIFMGIAFGENTTTFIKSRVNKLRFATSMKPGMHVHLTGKVKFQNLKSKIRKK
jgi:hypothetical protein